MMVRRLECGFFAIGVVAFCLSGCDGEEKSPEPPPSAAPSAVLTSEMLQKPLAKVGERTITLGDYVQTLERMDQFERLRYQSPERRRQLLDEMIEVELLAQEARRRGLDKEPETRMRLRQVLRDELLEQVRRKLPEASAIPESEVRAYYDAHRADFDEPERRRVAVIELSSKAQAEKLLEEAKQADADAWGKLVKKHSRGREEKASPLELAGDLGIVSAPAAKRGENERVPPPVREALFRIPEVGGVHGAVVSHDKRHFIVKLTGRTPARGRSFDEAERTIRVLLLQERAREAEAKLERELRKRYPVKLDDAELKRVSVDAKDPGDAPPK